MKDPPFKELLFDLETAPALGYFYDYSKEYNIIEILRHSFMFSVAWKWRGEEPINVKSLPDFPIYKRDKHDDRHLVKFLHDLISKANVVIGHNGDRFDIKYANSRFLFHRLSPPPPYKTRDTLKISRKIQNVPSHRLDSLSRLYEIGHKIPNTGKDLWLRCYNGDLSAWKDMKEYNKHDVYLLDKLMDIFDPWDKTAPNRSFITRKDFACPRCGSTHVIKQGYKYVSKGYKQRYQCVSCGGYIYDTKVEPLNNITLRSE